MNSEVYVRNPGLVPYEQALKEMRAFTDARTSATTDEIWLLEHPPVYTLGTNGAEHHILNAGKTPVIRVDRGGQVTWHGPGQLVVYVLLDLKRKNLGVRNLVCSLERAVISALERCGIAAQGKEGAPGVYTEDGAKIASIGLRIRHHRSYHGIAVNVNTDLQAFTRINPCGYEGLRVTQTADRGGPDSVADMRELILPALLDELGLTPVHD